jgi:bifunctional DNA-binding transcriptional regulator/antitoxin component of YhaV-PrlF toxin-antitoxin module
MVKLQENKNRFFITIPKEFVKYMKWNKGQEILVTLDRISGNLELIKYVDYKIKIDKDKCQVCKSRQHLPNKTICEKCEKDMEKDMAKAKDD